jgi:F0F1-type ATP synthase assembly protein I
MILGYLLHFMPRTYKDFVIERYTYTPGIVKVVLAVLLIIVVYQIQQAESVPFIYTDY